MDVGLVLTVGLWVVLLSTQPGPVAGALKGKFVLLGDLHYDPTYETTGESCNTDFPAGERGKYGDYECDSPWALIELAVHKTLMESHQADFVVWNGDNTRHFRNKTWISEDDILTTLANLTDYITRTILDTPVFPILGNHDYYPKNQLPGDEDDPLHSNITDIWKPLLEPIGAIPTFRKGGYYSVLLKDSNIRVVILNTNLYLTGNKATVGDTDPGGQYAWLRNVLKAARNDKESLHIFGHVPPGPSDLDADYKMFTDNHNLQLNAIVREFADVIVGMHCGHTHTDTFHIYYDKAGMPVVPVLIHPSVTPWRWPGGPQTMPHNPAVRVVSYSTQPNNVFLTDYVQYYLDLEKANRNENTAAFVLEYTFTTSYGRNIDNVTAEALHVVAERFKPLGSDQFHDYYIRNSVSLDSTRRHPCSCECKETHICSIQHIDYDTHRACIEQHLPATCGASLWRPSLKTLLPLLVFPGVYRILV